MRFSSVLEHVESASETRHIAHDVEKTIHAVFTYRLAMPRYGLPSVFGQETWTTAGEGGQDDEEAVAAKKFKDVLALAYFRAFHLKKC